VIEFAVRGTFFYIDIDIDLERTTGQSRLHNVITVLSAPSEDISVPAMSNLSRSTAVDLAVVDII